MSDERPRPCEVLHGFELHSCRGIAEGMDANGVLVCRPCGKNRKMTGGTYIGWFVDQPKRDEEAERSMARFWEAERRRLRTRNTGGKPR